MDSTLKKNILSRVLFSVYLALLFLLVIFIGRSATPKVDENVYLYITVVEIVVFVLPSLIYLRIGGFDYTKDLFVRIPEINKLPTVISALIVMISANILLGFIIPNVGGNSYDPTGVDLGDNLSIIGVIIALSIVPAVCEEFAFRAVIMRQANRSGAFLSIIVTSLLFAMIHFDKAGFIAYFINGVILALTVYITRSVVVSMITHALYNLYSLFIENRIWTLISSNVNLTIIIFFFLLLLLIGLLALFHEGAKHFSDYYLLGKVPPEGYIGYNNNEEEDEGILADLQRRIPVIDFLGCAIPCIIIYVINTIFGG